MNNFFGQPMYPQNISYSNQNSLIRVTGIEGAKAYQMYPNSTVALFDSSEDIMYVKTTDGAGFPTIRTFTFSELKQDVKQEINKNYVSREEMEEYVKQFIQQPANTNNKSKYNADNTTNAIREQSSKQ